MIEAWRPGTDGAVDGTRKMVTVSSLNDDGTKVLLDRIGGEGGNYFSPLQSDSTPYGLKERAIGDYLPESQIDINDSYHLYEMQQDFTRENFENAINNIVDMDEREVLQDQLQKYYDDARSTIETIGHDGEAYAGTQNGVKSGIIDKMFEMDDGGAIQYITPFNAEMLVELGMLKRVK